MSEEEKLITPLAFVEIFARMRPYTFDNATQNTSVDAIATMNASIDYAREILDAKLGLEECRND